MKGFLYFIKYAFSKQKGYIITGVLLAILRAIFPLFTVYIPKYILDETISGFKNRAFMYLVIYITVYICVNLLISRLDYINGIFGGRLFAKFQIDMANKQLDADLAKIESRDFQEQSARAQKYIYADGMGFGYIFNTSLEVFSKVITAIGYIVIIFTFSPLLVILNLFFTFISMIIESRIKIKEKMDNNERVKHERRTVYYTNVCSEHKYSKDIRMFSYKNTLLNKMKQHYNINNNLYKRINKRHYFSSVISNLFFVIQLLIGYYFVINLLAANAITAGEFTLNISTLTLYTGIVGEVMNKLVYIFSYDMYFNDFKEYMNIPSMEENGHNIVNELNTDNIVFKFENVSFKYSGSKDYALKNINIKFGKNDRIAMVGENGSGKSTFIKLLMRLYDPTEGIIYLNGIDIRKYKYDEYIKLFSVVFQDFCLFAASIEENITMNENLSLDSSFKEELKSIGLLNKVFSVYPKKFHTKIYKIFDDDGIEPSGGEGQQIAITRSLYKNAQINILDEPTAALDPKIEFDLYQKYAHITKKNLSFFISHRLASCKFANRILVFYNGEILEDGNHSELILEDGMYAKLFRNQASLYNITN